MKTWAVLVALEAVVAAQPQPGPTPELAVRMTTAARNAAAHGRCDLVDALAKRVRELDAAYYAQTFATDDTISRCLPDASPPATVAGPPGTVVATTPSLTIEAGLGAAQVFGRALPVALGGPALGIGGFVTSNVALSVRLSGWNFFFMCVGVLGPHAQVWLGDHAWLGGGAGWGFAAGRFDGVGGNSGIGLDARLGYAFRPRGQSGANVSIEMTYDALREPDTRNYDSYASVAVMVGYQTF